MASNTWIGDDYVDANGVWIPGKVRYQEGWVRVEVVGGIAMRMEVTPKMDGKKLMVSIIYSIPTAICLMAGRK